MKAKTLISGKKQVDELVAKLEHPFKAEIEEVRRIILETSDKICERVKWNSPSFYSQKTDFGAFHLRNQKFVHLIVVYPPGSLINNDTQLLEGDHKDRREIKFYSMDDVLTKKDILQTVVNDWLNHVND